MRFTGFLVLAFTAIVASGLLVKEKRDLEPDLALEFKVIKDHVQKKIIRYCTTDTTCNFEYRNVDLEVETKKVPMNNECINAPTCSSPLAIPQQVEGYVHYKLRQFSAITHFKYHRNEARGVNSIQSAVI